MAINEDTSLPNRHVFVAAKSGGGKSQTMRNVLVPSQGARVLFWDPDKDHQCTHYTDKRKFIEAVMRADKAKKPFRIGWAGDSAKDVFKWWCQVAWRILDGRFDTYLVTEELADLDMKNTVPPEYNTLSKRSRKYGGILIGNTQRIQDVPKTFVTQANELWIGLHDFHDAKYLEKITGLEAGELAALPPLSFYMRKSGGLWELKKVPYKAFGKKKRGARNQFNG